MSFEKEETMRRDPRMRRPRGVRLALLCLAPLVLAPYRCPLVPPDIRVLAPAPGEALTRMPLTLELDFHFRADPESLLVTLNGQDVTDLLEVDPVVDGRRLAWADYVWGASLVLEGTNVIEAEVVLDGLPRTTSRVFTAEGDPYADAVESAVIGASGGFNLGLLPDVVLGPPTGAGLYGGTLGVFALGTGGEIVVEFTDNVIVDGPGFDFTVFENPFFETNGFEILTQLFSEAGAVSVSQDGVAWYAFPCADTVDDHPYYPGCAGVYPVLADGETDLRHPSVPTEAPPITGFLDRTKTQVGVPDGSGGDSFDLADVGLGWARYVRIVAADHVVGPVGPDNAGFDLDAVAAVNARPATDLDGDGIPDAVQ